MAEQSAKELLAAAVAAARERDLPKAEKLVKASLRQDPTNDMAWLVLASVTESNRNKLISLQKALQINPLNTQALSMADKLGVDPQVLMDKAQARDTPPDPTPEPEPTPSPPVFTEDTISDAPADNAPFIEAADDIAPTDGSQRPDEAPNTPPPDDDREVSIPKPPPRPETYEERVQLYADEAQALAEDYLQAPLPPDNITWVKKDSNRAGKREILLVRAAAGAAIFVGVILPLIILGSIIWSIPQVRQAVSNVVVQIAGNPTPINSLVEPTTTPTPSLIPTNTPGFTATPSSTPTEAIPSLTPSSTAPFRAGNPLNRIATEFPLPGGVSNRAVRDASVLIANGEYAPAIATLQIARAELGDQAFNSKIYYQEARALIEQGEPEDALALVEQAQGRLQEIDPNNVDHIATLAGARAEAYVSLFEQALEDGDANAANELIRLARQDADRAIQNAPDWAQPYIVMAESYVENGDTEQSLAMIQQAIANPSLQDNLNFFFLEALVATAEGRLEDAAHKVELLLYGDPANKRGNELRTEITIRIQLYPRAVQDAQTHLFYYPNDIEMWTRLGDIRVLEGNEILALEAYNQAILIGNNTEQPPAVNAYIGQAAIYEARRQPARALASIAAAYDATTDPELRIRQMQLAYAAGEYQQASLMLQELRENGTLGLGEANFMEARLISVDDTLMQSDYQAIVTLIDSAFGDIPDEDQPTANALRARAYYQLGDANTALAHINSALQADKRPAWYLLRGLIYEELGEFQDAILEFERVLALIDLIPTTGDVQNQALNGIRRNQNNLLAIQATAEADS